MKVCPKNLQGSGNQGNRTKSLEVAPPDKTGPKGAISGTYK